MDIYWVMGVSCLVYVTVGVLNAARSARKLLRIVRSMKLSNSRGVVAMAMAVAFFLWPFDVCSALGEFILLLWKTRKKIKAVLLGYHGSMTAAGNVVDIWRLFRVSLRDRMQCVQDFEVLDAHMMDLACCCHRCGYGAPVSNELWPCPWLDEEKKQDQAVDPQE